MFCILSKHFNFIATFMIACSGLVYVILLQHSARHDLTFPQYVCYASDTHNENYVESQLAGRSIVGCPLECYCMNDGH